MDNKKLSLLAEFDDARRCVRVLIDGTAEEEFLKILELHRKLHVESKEVTSETHRIQRELDASLQSMADLETKLFHARRLLEMETKARKEAEYERDQMERKIMAVADLLQYENNLRNETRDKLACAIHTLPRKRKSLNPRLDGRFGEINSTGSFLSDLSITQSDDDFLDENITKRKHRLSNKNISKSGNKKLRLSTDQVETADVANTSKQAYKKVRRSKRRSSKTCQEHINIVEESEQICATTKVIIPPDGRGPIRAESTIETVPVIVHQENVQNNEADWEAKNSTSCMKTLSQPNKSRPLTNVLSNINSPLNQPHLRQVKTNRTHNFNSKTFIRAENCLHCQKKIRFGSLGLRCRDCQVRCHVDCRVFINVPCVPQSNTPTSKGLIGNLADYVPTLPPMIPPLIVHCVNEIENRGLNEVGIYRVSGSEREVKALKERFLGGRTTPNLSNIDIHVLCGCVKDFLRSLREPLIPTNMWKDFCNAVQNPSEKNIQKDLHEAVESMPRPNRDTLSFLILHFKRVAESREVLMPLDNIARVFGPTIVGYSSPDPDQHAILTEVYTQYTVMLNLLKINEHWSQYLDSDKENSTATPICSDHGSKDLITLYATPLKSTIRKRIFYNTPDGSKK